MDETNHTYAHRSECNPTKRMFDRDEYSPEYNAGFSGSKFAGSSLELHVGYEEGPWYIQAGPALANDGSDSEWGMSAKTGLSAAVSEKADLYTEVSYAKFKDSDAGYGIKLGSKYRF